MKSLYKKSGMNNQKAALIKKALKNGIKTMPHSSNKHVLNLNASQRYIDNLRPNKDRITILEVTLNKVIRYFKNFFDKLQINPTKRKKGRPGNYLVAKHSILLDDMEKIVSDMIAQTCDYFNIKERDYIKFFKDNPELLYELSISLKLVSIKEENDLIELMLNPKFRNSL
jgi:hypothetical protein